MLDGSHNPDTKTGNEYTAGLEMAGEVAAIGADAQTFTLGERVMGASLGAFAQGTTFSARTAEERAEAFDALLPEVMPAVAEGQIKAVIDSVIPFEHAHNLGVGTADGAAGITRCLAGRPAQRLARGLRVLPRALIEDGGESAALGA
jgi:NADPH:quinone reductase-like Zn-dependent oxidoreductase